MNKEFYYKLKWALEVAKPKDNVIAYNLYAKDVLDLMEQEEETTTNTNTTTNQEKVIAQPSNFSRQHKELMDKDYAKEDLGVKHG